MLRLKFYRILATRYKTPMGEIDIIAQRGNRIIAVEVKARATQEEAMASISAAQRGRIERALHYFIMRNPRFIKADLGLHAILVCPRRWPVHYPDFWRSE